MKIEIKRRTGYFRAGFFDSSFKLIFPTRFHPRTTFKQVAAMASGWEVFEYVPAPRAQQDRVPI